MSKPEIKLNLFCKDFFPSDSFIIEYLKKITKFNYIQSTRINNLVNVLFHKKPSLNSVDYFNFIGIDRSKITLYFKPW